MSRSNLATIDCFILAGGLGTRLASTVPDLPKVLAPIDGVPFLAVLLGWLKSFGARRVVIGLGHRADQVLSYLETSPIDGLDIVPIIEPAPLGTAGALRFAAEYFSTDPVLMLNGDSFVDADLDAFVTDHAASGDEVSLLCTHVDNTERFGTVVVGPDGAIEAFREKDEGCHGGGIINAGVYLLSRSFLNRLTEYEQGSLERDVFARMPRKSLHAFVSPGVFIDIGTPEDYARAPSILGPYLPIQS
mgnify:CR=1 FL=1